MKTDFSLLIAFVICIEASIIMVNIYRENKKVLFSRKIEVKIIKCEICSYVYFISHKAVFYPLPQPKLSAFSARGVSAFGRNENTTVRGVDECRRDGIIKAENPSEEAGAACTVFHKCPMCLSINKLS